MKTREFGVYVGTRRGRKGEARPVLDAAVMVADYRPAMNLVAILTSRPMFPGALRRQLVPAGRFLNFSRLAQGAPAAPHTVANGDRETVSP